MLLHSPATATAPHNIVARDNASTAAAAALLCPLRRTGLLRRILGFVMDARGRAHVIKVLTESLLEVGRPECPGCSACRVQNEVRHHRDLVALRLVVEAHVRYMAPDSNHSGGAQHGLGRDVASARRSNHAAVVQAGWKGAGIVEREAGH